MKNRFGLFAAALLFASALNAQQPPPRNGPPSPEERLKRTTEHLGKELALKPVQKQKLQAAYKDFFASMESFAETDLHLRLHLHRPEKKRM